MRFLTAVVLLLLALVAVYALLIRPWHVKWGATDAEAAASLPSDSLVSHPKISATHAITVKGSAADVWLAGAAASSRSFSLRSHVSHSSFVPPSFLDS